MKIAKCRGGEATFWGLVNSDENSVREIRGDFHDWARKLTRGDGEPALELADESIPLNDVRLLPPIEKTNRVVVAGANYLKHLAEFDIAAPPQPLAFLKAMGALIGANDEIRYPPLTKRLDHEVELVAVIGDDVDLDRPLDCVLGYTVGNDVSARDLQRSRIPNIGMDLFSAKSLDKTTAVGPWIVTRDEFPTGSPVLTLKCWVNGDLRQNGTTADMIWDVAELIRFVHTRSSFECGDILFTGTPDGVGASSGKYLSPGDLVEASVERIGTLRNVVGPKAA
ncbi:MAG: fumarylacetoacetate hydrolase family protein [Gammaproteobacteria bacterium]|nr:fumarylacetoacetate hydrolase family protein [Gammaproteobacteria bacterium]